MSLVARKQFRCTPHSRTVTKMQDNEVYGTPRYDKNVSRTALQVLLYPPALDFAEAPSAYSVFISLGRKQIWAQTTSRS